MRLAFIIVAVIVCALEFVLSLSPSRPGWSAGLLALGVAFFAASFAVPA